MVPPSTAVGVRQLDSTSRSPAARLCPVFFILCKIDHFSLTRHPPADFPRLKFPELRFLLCAFTSTCRLAAISKHPSQLRNACCHRLQLLLSRPVSHICGSFRRNICDPVLWIPFCFPLILIPETKILADTPLSSGIALRLPLRLGQRRCLVQASGEALVSKPLEVTHPNELKQWSCTNKTGSGFSLSCDTSRVLPRF